MSGRIAGAFVVVTHGVGFWIFDFGLWIADGWSRQGSVRGILSDNLKSRIQKSAPLQLS
jgi:hypothetical protein